MSSLKLMSEISSKQDPETIWELLEHIGTGSYGEVYKGRHMENGKIAAIKVIKLEPGEELDEVLHEVTFLQGCNHKNIVSYIGCYIKKGVMKGQKHVWIVMEFCGGGSVESAYKWLKTPLKEKEIACIIRESLLGLEFLHSCSKMHRDIKCGNILMTDEGGIKLADFGVSTQLTRTFSKRNTFIGTPYWMAPEVITAEQQGTAYDCRADIWSLGITAIEMAECSPPMFDMHPMRVLFMIPKLDPPTLKENKKWSKHFHDFLKVCLEKNPEKRPLASTLLKHPFVAEQKDSYEIIKLLVARMRDAKKNRSKSKTDSEEEEEEDEEEIIEEEESTDNGGTYKGNKNTETIKRQATVQQLEVSSHVNLETAKSASVISSPVTSTSDNKVAKRAIGRLSTDTSSIASSTASKKPIFKASRVCRLAIKINCAEYADDVLLLGTDDGLFSYNTNEKDSKIIPLSNRKYVQLNCLEDLGIMVSRSGKYDMVSTHVFDSASKFKKRQRFETETKLKKMKETKGCLFYTINRIQSDVYLCAATPRSILIMKYAPHPFNKFMKFKEILVDFKVTSLDLIEYGNDLRLYAGSPGRFKVVDLNSLTAEDLVIPGFADDKLGNPVRCVTMNDVNAICYSNIGVINNKGIPGGKENKTLTWRYSLQFASKLGQEFLVAGSTSIVDVISCETGKIVHVFETRRDKIKSLGLLVSKNEKLFLMAEEEKNDVKASSIILIELQGYA